MQPWKRVLLLCSLLVVVQACCLDRGTCQPCEPRHHQKACQGHPEPPFNLQGQPPGPGLVFGTADFDSSGSVLIKLQIEDLASVPGNEATITAWSGNGSHPSTNASPPAGGTQVYLTSGDVTLRHWTTHLDRTYDPAVNRYWLFVHVDHDIGDGSREHRYLWFEWIPTGTPTPDTPHDFNEY